MFLLGDRPDIDEGSLIGNNDTTEGNKTVTIGNPVNVHDGYSVTIDCTTVSGTPPITITWIRNETLIAEDVNTITITDAKDDEVITCRADNNIGYDEEGTTITVIGNFITVHIQILYYYWCESTVRFSYLHTA